MNRHERRAAAAARTDVQWSRAEGTAYRARLFGEHVPGAAEAWRRLVDAGAEPEGVWGLILDSSDIAAHAFQALDGSLAAERAGVIVAALPAAEGARFFCEVNEVGSPGEEEALLRRTRERSGTSFPVLVVGGGGSTLMVQPR